MQNKGNGSAVGTHKHNLGTLKNIYMETNLGELPGKPIEKGKKTQEI